MGLESFKIAFVVDRVYPFYYGGYEKMLYEYAVRLSSAHQVDIYTTSSNDLSIKNVSIKGISNTKNYINNKGQHSLPGAIKYTLASVINSSKIVGYDVTNMNSIPYLNIPIIYKLIKNKNKRIYTIFHEAWYDYPDGSFTNNLNKILIRKLIWSIKNNTDRIISVSQPTTHSLIKNYGFSEKNVYTIPIGVDIESIGKAPASENYYDLIYLGRLSSIKRVEELINVTYYLKNRGLTVKVGIIGSGELEGALKLLSQRLKVSDQVNFLGRLSDSDKYSVMKSAKIFVMPSEREGFSISTLEAMACGLIPIVAIPNHPELFGISHYIQDGVNGYYYQPGNLNQLGSIISELLQFTDTLNQIGSIAQKTAYMYNWPDIINMYLKMLKRDLDNCVS